METAVLKTSNEEIQDGVLNLNSESNDLASTKNLFTRNSVYQTNENQELNVEGTKIQPVNLHIDGSLFSNSNGNSPKMPNVLPQKSSPPNLIEHAFKVVKNIFSPDKKRGRASSLISPIPNRNSTGSPCNGVSILGKPEFQYHESDVEIGIQTKKADFLGANHLGLPSNSLAFEGQDNTDDSFLTTASLIDESFQSAVTHFDENGEQLRSEINIKSNVLNDSQNLEILDPYNESLSGSEYGLESTMLKNISSASTDTKRCNTSNGSKDVLSNSEINSSEEALNDSKRNLSNSLETCEKIGVIVQAQASTPNCESETQPSCTNSLNNGGVIVKAEDSNECNNDRIKVEDSRLNNSHQKCPSLPFKKSQEDSADSSTSVIDSETVEVKGSQKTDDCKSDAVDFLVKATPANQGFISKASDSEAESCVESSISTTTVVLSEIDSEVDDMLQVLNSDDNEAEASIVFFDKSENLAETDYKFNELIHSENTQLINISSDKTEDLHHRREKNLVDKERNTPVKSTKVNRMKSPVSRKSPYKTPKGRKSIRQKITEDYLLDLPLDIHSAESHIALKMSETRKIIEIPCTVNEGGDKVNGSSETNPEPTSTCSRLDEICLPSQQSYTILNIHDNLKRPIIGSQVELESSTKSTVTFDKDLEIRQTFSDLTNECSNISTETVCLVPATHQSTPTCGNASIKNYSPNDSSFVGSKQTTIPSTQSPELRNSPYGALINSKIAEISPVTPIESDNFAFSNISEKDLECVASPRGSPALNSTWVKPSIDLNRTIDRKPEPETSAKLNQTFDKISDIPEDSNNLNQTFDLKHEDLVVYKLSSTFEKKSETLNQTFEVNSQSPTAIPSSPTKQLIKILEEKPENIQLQEEEPVPGNVEPVITEKSIATSESESCPTTVNDNTFIKPEDNSSDNKETLNSSFLSTTSSNASLLCQGNATVISNQEPLRNMNVGDDLGTKIKGVTVPIDASTQKWLNGSPDEKFLRPSSPGADEKLPESCKDEELHCDPQLVKLIQEQFTSVDIEKICSVVDDMSSVKLSNNIITAEERFEKSLHKGLPNGEMKMANGDCNPKSNGKVDDGLAGKFTSALSPQGFDFLGSIRGKPTGRDLSRESLYVKFDPLVQAPCANSLIDFTKEVEALASLEASPRSQDVVEHLLTISPQKKPDDIVPPLTPLSQRNKREDKEEKLKELQNEIYFLKNLYAERERNNKAKLSDYESQIARLTGQSCILEDKLKESNEREKSLVKKLNEQTQSMEQLKAIMEEYVRVISKLATELETLKSENSKQVQTLTLEKDSYVTHLQNTEAAFTDVHAKYEKSKKTITSLKSNEAMYKNTIAEQMEKMEEYKEKAREVRERACKEFQKLQDELNEAKGNHSQETARLRAQLRKTELKLEAIQEALDQKIKENDQLTAICDELIEGKK